MKPVIFQFGQNLVNGRHVKACKFLSVHSTQMTNAWSLTALMLSKCPPSFSKSIGCPLSVQEKMTSSVLSWRALQLRTMLSPTVNSIFLGVSSILVGSWNIEGLGTFRWKSSYSARPKRYDWVLLSLLRAHIYSIMFQIHSVKYWNIFIIHTKTWQWWTEGTASFTEAIRQDPKQQPIGLLRWIN